MPNPTRIRAVKNNGIVDVKILMNHIMESGYRRDDKGNPIPPHYIQKVLITSNEQTVLYAQFGTGIARNPYLEFKFERGKVGDSLAVTWVDSEGEERTDEVQIR